jgi:hypothetical protein
MDKKYQIKEKQTAEDRTESGSIIGLYEMLSQNETDIVADYSSIIDKIEEMYESVEMYESFELDRKKNVK